MLGRTDSRLRMMALLLVFVMFGSAAVLRLGYWQVVAAPALASDAISSMTPPREARVARAQIIDRRGTVLAQTAAFDRLDAHPKDIDPEDRELIVATLTDILDLDVAEQEAYLAKLSSDKAWDWLDRRLTIQQSAEIRIARDDRLLPGISLAPQAVRTYPRKGGQPGTTVANHLLGFVATDGRGSFGVEGTYDDRLTGKDTSSVPLASLDGLPGGLEGFEAPPLRLTIDFKLQKQLEKELNAARVANKAKRASAIVMDPHTGEILASASVPGYNANDFAKVASEQMGLLRNPVVSDQYEPGSVMKIFTATAALDLGVVTPRTIIHDDAKMEFYKHTVRNADHASKGRLRVKDVIALSRNVATAKIARKLAPNNDQKAAQRLYDLWKKVGMTDRTGVDIANEARGTWYDPRGGSKWAPVDVANRAFGQGVSVTLLQLATGVSTLVNGGYRIQPHVVTGSETAGIDRRRVLEPKVARQAQDILVHVTGSVPWYADGSLIPGYMIGGKTGTAQIWDADKQDWKGKRFNHSFIGFVGGDRPEAVIAVRIEEPKPLKIEQGLIPLKIESYELFQMIARGAIKHLGIKKSKDRNAGLPILGTDAARRLTPQRQANAKQQARQQAGRQADKKSDKSKAKSDKGARAEDSDKARKAKGDRARDKARRTTGGQGARSPDSAAT